MNFSECVTWISGLLVKNAIKLILWLALLLITTCITFVFRNFYAVGLVLIVLWALGFVYAVLKQSLWHLFSTWTQIFPIGMGYGFNAYNSVLAWLDFTPPPPYYMGSWPLHFRRTVLKPYSGMAIPSYSIWYSFLGKLPRQECWFGRLWSVVMSLTINDYVALLLYVAVLAVVVGYLLKVLAPFINKMSPVSLWLKWREVYCDVHQFLGFMPEKLMAGSVLSTVPQPQFQCDVLVRYPGMGFVYAGQAFKVDNYIYTANHVVAQSTGVRLRTKAGVVEIYDLERIMEVEGDIARVLLTPQEEGKLCLKSGRFSEVVSGKVLVTCYGNEQQSQGFVQPYDAFGYVSYNGSTLPGHSGAPYLLGKAIVGMHLGGQSVNIGYDGQYLRMVHKQVQEDSDEYIMELCQRGAFKRALYRQSPYSPDDFQVKVHGKYYNVDRDTIYGLRSHGIELDSYTGEALYDEEGKVTPVVHYDVPKMDVTFEDLVPQNELPKNEQRPSVSAGDPGTTLITPEEAVQALSTPLLYATQMSQGRKLQPTALLSSMLARLKDLSSSMPPESIELKEQAEIIALKAMTDTKRSIRSFLDLVNGVIPPTHEPISISGLTRRLPEDCVTSN